MNKSESPTLRELREQNKRSREEVAAELEKYFGEIDGLLKERLRDVKERAEAIYREYVKEEISKLKAKKTVMEAGG